MKSTVSLTTTGMQNPVSIHAFQFGSVPAQTGSYELTADSVLAGASTQEFFWFERNEVSVGQYVRFNLRFELNIHNSADLQVRLGPGAEVQWRWAAPIGFIGNWSQAEQQAPWSDANMFFCININGTEGAIEVSLSEQSAVSGVLCASIPPEQDIESMIHPRTSS